MGGELLSQNAMEVCWLGLGDGHRFQFHNSYNKREQTLLIYPLTQGTEQQAESTLMLFVEG